MQAEERNVTIAPNSEVQQRNVSLVLRSRCYVINGHWAWELHTDAVYCSDVMLSYPPDLEGTKSLVHPDDVPAIATVISEAVEGQTLALSFRIITTYGEVKTLQGTDLTLQEKEPLTPSADNPLEAFLAEQERAAREEWEQFCRCSSELLESLTQAGTWWYNLSTGETWYSDAVFRLHGLLPQSLNSHLHTFHPFLHSDDRTAVLDALSTALSRQVPLQVEYRLVLPDNTQKRVQQNLNWTFTQKGQPLLHGFFRDVTESRATEEQMELAQAASEFQKQLLSFAEGAAGLGFWQLNVVTRKLVYSDNYYRIFGLKPQSLPAGFGSFLNYIHPDDRERYEAVLQQVRTAQTAPAIDFRVVLPDGKVRHVRQKGRSLVAGTEVMMVGTLQDVTVQKGLEKKLAELQEAVRLQQFLHQQAETLGGMASWRWNLKTGDIVWSDAFYELLGQKPGVGRLTQKLLQQAVHPEDLHTFNDALGLLLTEGNESDFAFRLISKGMIRHLQATFRLLSLNGQDYFIGTVQDRSEEEKTRRDLTSRMDLVEKLSDSIPDLIMVTDTDHTVMLWNRSCETYFGVKKEKAIGQNFFDLLPQLKEDYAFRLLERALEGEKQELVNFQPPPPLRGFYNISLLPMRDDGGKVIGTLHLLQNVTKEHQLHQALSGRLQLIEKLVEASVDRIIALDRDMNYLYWNQKAEEHYGLQKDAVIGKNILEVFPRHQQLPSYVQFREALRGHTVHLSVGSKETEAYTETYLIPVLNQKGEADAVLWITHDLSAEYRLLEEQKRAEEQIREQSYYLQRITETVPDMISIMELETKKFTFLNAETFREHGFDAEEMARHTKEENELIVYPDDRPLLNEYFQRLAQASDEETISAEYRAMTDAGEWNWFLVRGKVFQRNESGKATHVLNAIENITEKKNAEQELKESRDLLEAVSDNQPLVISAFRAMRDDDGVLEDLRWVYANSSHKKYNGGIDVIGKCYRQVYPGAEKTEIWKAFCRVIDTGEPFDKEHYYAEDGINNWFRTYAVKFEDGLVVMSEDITARKQVEQEILLLKDEVAKKATDKYLSLFNSIDEGFCIIEVLFDESGAPYDYRFCEANQAFEKQTGLTDAIGKTIRELAPAHEQHWFDIYGKIAKTGEPVRFENPAKAIGHYYEVYAFRVGAPGENQVAVLFNDITKRKQEEERQAFLLKLSDALRPLKDAVLIEETVTREALNFFGADRCYYCEIEGTDALIRRDAFRGDVPSVAGRYPLSSFAIFAAVIKSGKTFVVQDVHTTTLVDEALRELCVQMQVISFVDVPVIKEGKAAGVLCLVQKEPREWTESEVQLAVEIAERTWASVERAKAEEFLRQSEEQYRKLFQTMEVGFVVCQPLRDEKGKIVNYRFLQVNPAIEKLTGWKAEEMVGKTIADLLPNLEDWRLEAYQKVIDAQQSVRLESFIPGLNRWYDVTAFYYGEEQFAAYFDDITGRKLAEEALRKSEENYRIQLQQEVDKRTSELKEGRKLLQSVFDASSQGIMVLQAIRDNKGINDFEILLHNAITHQWNGKELTGKKYAAEFPAIRRNGLLDALKHVMETGEPISMELYYGEGRFENWFQVSAVKLDEEQLVTTAEDITARKKAEEEIKKNLAILQQAEEVAQIGSWEYELATGAFHWSEGMYRLFGLPQGSKVKAEIYLDLAREEDRPVARRIIKNLKAKPQNFEELLWIKKETVARLLKVNGVVVHDAEGKAQRIIGLDMDITDIKQARTKLQETQHWLQQTALASPDAITVYDLQKKQPVYLNNCLAEWLGMTSEELVSMGIDGRLELVHPNDRLNMLHFNEKIKAARDGEVQVVEYRLCGKNDTLLWVRNRSKVFLRDAGGNVTHILSILQDVTEEKAAEEVLKALNASLEKKNQELESKNEEITSFAFVASHDLREPLRKIHTFSDWLLTKEPLLSETGRLNVEKMTGAVKRLELLINDILALTKVHEGNDQVQAVDLNRLLQQLKEEMQEKLQRTGAVIDADELPFIAGAENQLLYLFKNLISNAIKFQPKEGHPVIRIKAEREGDWQKIAVSDNGLGIPEEYHKKIFEMFRRLHSREEYEGTGMGLSICKKIMEKHGGKITLESRPGKGSTFTCWFPALLSTNTGE